MKIMILGKDGMLGEIVTKYFQEQAKENTIICPDRTSYDARELKTIEKLMIAHYPDYVINCVGILNNNKDIKLHAQVNIAFPHYLNHLSYKYDYKLFHISTNCVFKDMGPHASTDTPNATDIYGQSKMFGEIFEDKNVTIRTSIIGASKNGSGLMNWFLNNEKDTVTGYVNAMWNGVTTLELAKQMYSMIEKNEGKQLVQIATSASISKCNLLDLIKTIYRTNKTVVPSFNKEAHSSLLIPDIEAKSIQEQLVEFKEWYK